MDPPPSRPEPEHASRRLAILFALVIAAVYANGLTIPFQFDDEHALEHNPAIRSLANIPRFFVDPNTSTVLRENKDLRPVLEEILRQGQRRWKWRARAITHL